MTLFDRVHADLLEAMRARDAERVGTLRMLVTALKNERIAKMRDLSDEASMAVVQREVKRRKEAATTYRAGGRAELAEKEEAEAKMLGAYLPEAMPEDALRALVHAVVADVRPGGPADFGKVMGGVMKQVAGRAEGSFVQQVVKEELAKL